MERFPFPHDGRVHLISDDRFQVAYYARGYLKYKRIRDTQRQSWKDTVEEQIDQDSYWMIVACVELAKFVRGR